jgi:hypothetical protein
MDRRRVTMRCPQSRLNFDQPAYFDEIVGRNLEQVHGSYCVAQHECEQQESRACHGVVRALGHHGVAGAEEDRILEVNLAAARLGLPQRDGEVGHLDEAEVCGDLPKTLAKLLDVEALGAGDARHIGKFDRQRDDALLQGADLLDMADQS